MPRGTVVDNAYRALLKQGKSKSSAAKIAQATTGRSLKTGKPPKRKANGGRKPPVGKKK